MSARKRPSPINIEVERVVIEEMLVFPETIRAARGLIRTAECFYDWKNRQMYEALLALDDIGDFPDGAVSVTGLREQLRRAGHYTDYLGAYVGQREAAAMLRLHEEAPGNVRMLIEVAVERRQMEIGQSLAAGTIDFAQAAAQLENARQWLEQAHSGGSNGAKPALGLKLRRVSEIAAERITWLWRGYVPLGELG
ncbi:MAG TPA: DnaB-like helicase N-terminal domain-containing protein, partial [Ktedonobacterales bacterium]|nr:DnaB-like helicase N-terminal domain-containing protein [Ktedonobacterales bacterium]